MNFFKSSHYPVILLLGAGLTLTSAPAQNTSETPSPFAQSEPAPGNGQVVEDIVAMVNDQIITQSDYDRAEQSLEADDAQQDVPSIEAQARKKDLLRDLIDQQLLLSKGKELGITGETELVKRLDNIRKQNHLDSMEALEKAAQAQGVSYEDFKANIRNQIITQQVVDQEVASHLSISQAEVRNYYQAHQSEFSHPESVTLQEILIGTPPDAGAAQIAAAESKANDVEAKLKAGANFGDLAKSVSSGPTAAEGGGLGEFTRGKLGSKELEDATFSLKAGQFTAPIRTKQGFLILLVNQHTSGGETSFTQAEPEVEQAIYVQRMEPALREYLTTLRDGAAIFIKPGYVDSGASPNEIQITNSAYVPPGPKKKKKFQRTRFRGRTRKPKPAVETASATTTAPAAAAKPASKNKHQVASTQKPGKREKIRFGQAPRESLPSATGETTSQTASAAGSGGAAPAADGVSSSSDIGAEAPPPAKPQKTRFSDRAKVHKEKRTKAAAAQADQPPPLSAEDLANQKVQDAPLGLAGNTPAKTKKKQKGPKTRYSEKKAPPKPVQQPYMGPSQADQNPPAAPPQAAGSGQQPPAPPAPAQPGGSPQ